MWTTENRPRYNRDKLRYPSDLTDEEWTVVEPLIPPALCRERHRAGYAVRRAMPNGSRSRPSFARIFSLLSGNTSDRIRHSWFLTVPQERREGDRSAGSGLACYVRTP